MKYDTCTVSVESSTDDTYNNNKILESSNISDNTICIYSRHFSTSSFLNHSHSCSRCGALAKWAPASDVCVFACVELSVSFQVYHLFMEIIVNTSIRAIHFTNGPFYCPVLGAFLFWWQLKKWWESKKTSELCFCIVVLNMYERRRGKERQYERGSKTMSSRNRGTRR